MEDPLLTSSEAAQLLGISVTSLYDWLTRSDQGEFMLRGHPFTINYLQGGTQGQGRIFIEKSEIERMKNAMRVRPRSQAKRHKPVKHHYPGITVPLGRPKE